MIDASVPVVVIFRGGYGAVAIARTLGRLGVPMYLVAQEGTSTPVWSSRHWHRRVRWDFSRPEGQSVQFLVDLGRSIRSTHQRPAIVLTLADWVAIFLERNAEVLKEQFVLPLPREPVLHALLNKWGMHQLASRHGIPTPTTISPDSRDDVERFVESVGIPIMMKAADPFLPDPPATSMIRSRAQLNEMVAARQDAGLALNMVLQEYIPGGVDSVWMCNGYFGEDPARTLTFTGQKLRQVSAAGVASLAICVQNDTVAAQTRRFMEEIGYRGCVGIGHRYDARDGRYKLLDVNARVSGVFRLFAGTNEIDVVRACYLDLTGQQAPASELQPGRKWMLEDDFAPAFGAIHRHELTLREWIRSLRGVRELHWMAADDPLPGLVWLRDRLRSAAGYVRARRARTG